MSEDQNEELSYEDVIAILVAAQGIEATVVGGQAINFWGEYFRDRAKEDLAQFAPFTSKDIDYFGLAAAAQQLADKLGGKAVFPEPEDHTPNSAIVQAEINGRQAKIDFLGGVLGVRPSEMGDGALLIVIDHESAGLNIKVSIRVLHPLLCLKSRAANMITLRRADDVTKRQYAVRSSFYVNTSFGV
ncbi:MAG TPA: hypothetical protein VLL76_06120 [Candidatus Omnitrophota bacterium]|nr:hypothetical protein [Candidatus Omnitrophota bacterium]